MSAKRRKKSRRRKRTAQKTRVKLGWRAGAAAVCVLCLPALLNSYPLLYPDSIEYLHFGQAIGRTLLGGAPSQFYGIRSAFYSLSVYPLHGHVTPWPIVVFHALLMTAVLWLCLRSVLPEVTRKRFLVCVSLMTALSTAGIFVSLVLPDVLTPLLILSVYLLSFARERLERHERAFLLALAFYALVCHSTNLLLAPALALAALLLHRIRRDSWAMARRGVGALLALTVLAIGAQVGLNAALYGVPSLSGPRPLFLMARVLADGTGRRYVREHGSERDWAINAWADRLPESASAFLWRRDGVMKTATREQLVRLRAEELPFAWAVLRTYPLEQARASLGNALRQLVWVRPDYLGPSPVISGNIDRMFANSGHARSRQARGALPLGVLGFLHAAVAAASALAVAGLAFWLRRAPPRELLTLTALVALALVVNASITASLSMVAGRFQARVIWLVPLLACLFFYVWRDRTGAGSAQRTAGDR